jgi:SAM-dependent methyltransferase
MKINDNVLVEKMKNLIFHDGDIRPVWVGPGIGETDISEYKNYAKWANEHWGLYRGFNDLVKESDNTVILDLGCGCGFCTINLSDIFKKSILYGYDIDFESINFANEYNKNDKTEYFTENILNTDLPNSDYIFLIETLEHIKHIDHYSLIDKCLSSLKPNGLLFISTPNENSFSDAERGHIGILTPHFFEDFKKKYEKNIIEVKYFNNKKLLDEVTDFTVIEPASHFKIILKNG